MIPLPPESGVEGPASGPGGQGRLTPLPPENCVESRGRAPSGGREIYLHPDECPADEAGAGVREISELLSWLYIVNATLLMNHELDAVHWKEWELFRVRGGVTGFILLHIPLVLLVLLGLLMVLRSALWASVLSIVLGAVGVFTFSIHAHYLRMGRPEFRDPLSLALLCSILVVSIAQLSAAAWSLL